jgi:hypothetical protein
MPRPNEESNIITITGPKEGIEKAEHEIRLISDEQVIIITILKVFIPEKPPVRKLLLISFGSELGEN